MQSFHDLTRVSAAFDEDTLLPAAGLLPAAVLTQRLDLGDLVADRLHLDHHGANSDAKAVSVIGAILAGADSIDDCNVLRTAAMTDVFNDVRAPSTLGSWLRAFRWHNVRELDAVSRELLARLFTAGAGPDDLSAAATIDIDSTIVGVYGPTKQGADYGYTKVRGYHPQIATLAGTGQVLHARLRGGAAGAARGAKTFLAETVSRLRNAGATGPLTVRADSAFYSRAVLSTATKLDVRFSVTAKQDKRIRAAIDTIDETAWAPIPYWLTTAEVSAADVAETSYVAFAGTPQATRMRLIVRRTRPTPGSQLALFTEFAYHALVTDRVGDTLELEADHRRHAIVEQSIAELKGAGLAHLPSASFAANAAWLALSVMAHNIARAVGAFTRAATNNLTRARVATIIRALFTMPGRLIRHGRRIQLRLPTDWPWAEAFTAAMNAITAIPMRT